MSKIVNQTELSLLHGVSDVTIWQWQKEGMPVAKINTRGHSNEYDVAATIEWREQRAVKRVRDESPRDALARAQTELTLQTIAERERQLVRVSELEPALVRMVVMARQQLLQIPGLMRAMLDQAGLLLLEGYLHQALKELARYDPSSGTHPAADPPLGAAEEALGGGVGGGRTLPERQVALPGPVPARPDAVSA